MASPRRFTYGPQASWYSELFPANVRFSGVAISYALGAIVGGAFAPTIAQSLISATGTTHSVSIYLVIMFLISTAAALLLQDKRGRSLGIDGQQDQERYALLRGSRAHKAEQKETVEV